MQGKFEDNFNPENKTSIEEIEKRKLYKKSSCMGKNLERMFEINNKDKFAYFADAKAQKPKKELEIEKVECKIQEKSKLKAAELKTWNDQRSNIRVAISLPKKSK